MTNTKIRKKNRYMRPSRKVDRDFSIAIPQDKGILIIYPLEKFVQSFDQWPEHIPKRIFLENAALFFRKNHLPEQAQFIYVKNHLFCYVSKNYKISCIQNFLYFYQMETNQFQERKDRLIQVIDFFHSRKTPVKMTLASSAYNFYHVYSRKDKRTRTCSNPIISQMFNDELSFFPLSLARPGKFLNVYKYDVNSAYPFQMKSDNLPCAFYAIGTNKKRDLERNLNGNMFVFALCSFNKPPLTYPNYENGSIWMCGDSLKYELLSNNIHKIHKKIIFTKTEKCDLIEKWYENRKSSNKFESKLWKNILNCIFGQFSKRIHEIKMFEPEEFPLPECDLFVSENESWRVIHLKSISLHTRKQGEFHMFSAPWLSYAVFQNHQQFFMESIKDSSPIYIDTDCVVLPGKLQSLKISDSIGDWKKEKILDFRVYSSKNYSKDLTHVLAGIKKDDKITILDRGLKAEGLRNNHSHSEYRFYKE